MHTTKRRAKFGFHTTESNTTSISAYLIQFRISKSP